MKKQCWPFLQTEALALQRPLSVNEDSVDIQSGYFSIKMGGFLHWPNTTWNELVLYITSFKTLPNSTIGSNTCSAIFPQHFIIRVFKLLINWKNTIELFVCSCCLWLASCFSNPLKRLFFLLWTASTTLSENQLDKFVWVCFWVLCSEPLICVCPSAIPHTLDYNSSTVKS